MLHFSKSNSDYKFYSRARLHVNVDFYSGAEWEVTGGEATNGEQRSSCIRGTARAQGSTWRTEPSDLLCAISPHPREYNAQNPSCCLSALALNMDHYSIIFTVSHRKIICLKGCSGAEISVF